MLCSMCAPCVHESHCSRLMHCVAIRATNPRSRSASGHKHRPLSVPSPSLCLHHSRKLPSFSVSGIRRTMPSSLNSRRMTMEDENSILPPPKRTPWNKGKLIGAKPPLLARHVWSIRTKLQIERRARELAMFNLAIDSKLRGCDVVAMKVEDVAPSGYPLARATVRQRKTGRPVRFELTEQTRQAVDDYLNATGKVPGEFLFTSRRRVGEAMTTRQYARLVAEWIAGIGLS